MTPKATLKAAVFDWAGTMIDFGSLAPMTTCLKPASTMASQHAPVRPWVEQGSRVT